jgi:electron transfer flavoprotein beta subunit
MQDSELIITINTDRNAPIHELASMAVIGDAGEILSALITQIRTEKDNKASDFGVTAGKERAKKMYQDASLRPSRQNDVFQTDFCSATQLQLNTMVCVSEGVFVNGILPEVANENEPLPIPNPCDAVAVEAAMQLKERHSGRVTLINIGSMHEMVLRAFTGLGADELVQVLDEGIDSLGANQVAWLAAQVTRPMKPDLILCGEHATGGPASGIVPFSLAEFLGLPIVTGAVAIEMGQNEIRVERLIERGRRQVLQSPWPVVVTLARAFGSVRYSAYAKANKATIRRYTLPALRIRRADFPICATSMREIGRRKAKPRMKKLYVPPSMVSAAERLGALMAVAVEPRLNRQSESKFVEEPPEMAASGIVDFLKREQILEV